LFSPTLNTILIADRDDLIALDARDGERKFKFEHDIERAQFVLINESGKAVVGGRDEIAAFQVSGSKFQVSSRPESQTSDFKFQNAFPKTKTKNQDENPNEIWRVKHEAPSRGVFRVVAGIALRATALYFRYGGLATSALTSRAARARRVRF
jgi:hypothetical protein